MTLMDKRVLKVLLALLFTGVMMSLGIFHEISNDL